MSAQGRLVQPGRGPQEACRAWQCFPCPPYPGVPAPGSGLEAQGSRCAFSEDVSFRPGHAFQSGIANTWAITVRAWVPTSRAEPRDRPPGSPRDRAPREGKEESWERSPRAALRVVTFHQGDNYCRRA